ncbi:Putative anti-sigma factor antagonist BtrV [Caballeronia arvi]|uniref:Anti-sigma factor antagonist n=1 Tax=Caballeronia arvi TaxID=1777135 RepID=A0A158L342_9BURK|nr:STAS domain-containing protein [Caballeronia arvi]SAL87071.1 Putative anti-sigma factor antagonist BtrV [Caballeronia arvi]
MNIIETREGEVLVVAVSGRIDSTTSKQLEDVLPERVQVTPRVLLDMSDVQYVSSAGLRVLLKAAKIARGTGHGLVLTGLLPQVLEVFQVIGFDSLFRIAGDRGEGMGVLGV